MTQEFEAWAKAYVSFSQDQMWPNETLIRLFKGKYVTNLSKDFKNKTVLDIGFGNGNNLIFLKSLGLNISGTEVHPDICKLVTDKLKTMNFQSNLKVGTNKNLPFEDNQFDFLVSWNVIHYEKSEQDMMSAIKEYARVLKPNGRMFLSTTGPTHSILQNAKTLGNHLYQIGREDDFRKGEIYFYFDNPDYIRFYFSKAFKDIQIGRIDDDLFSQKLDSFLVTATKL